MFRAAGKPCLARDSYYKKPSSVIISLAPPHVYFLIHGYDRRVTERRRPSLEIVLCLLLLRSQMRVPRRHVGNKPNEVNDGASANMITFLAVNTASLTLVPAPQGSSTG